MRRKDQGDKLSRSEETLREAIGTLLGRLRAFEPEDDDLAVDEVIAALPHLAQLREDAPSGGVK